MRYMNPWEKVKLDAKGQELLKQVQESRVIYRDTRAKVLELAEKIKMRRRMRCMRQRLTPWPKNILRTVTILRIITAICRKK